MPEAKNTGNRESTELAEKVLLSLFTVFRNLRPAGGKNLLPRIEPPAPRHVMALFHLAASGPMSVSELATHLGVTLTTASLSVTQMAAAELVIREEDPSDHRRTIVSISPKVEPAINEMFTSKVQTLEKGLAALGAKRSEAFLRDLQTLLQAIESEHELDGPSLHSQSN
ncbi:MAG: MarR family transcriptional regulator [Actinomycetota bacterium]|nr:MAG: MarR family transcriptional regulator [Actinomycetota bacterium]